MMMFKYASSNEEEYDLKNEAVVRGFSEITLVFSETIILYLIQGWNVLKFNK